MGMAKLLCCAVHKLRRHDVRGVVVVLCLVVLLALYVGYSPTRLRLSDTGLPPTVASRLMYTPRPATLPQDNCTPIPEDDFQEVIPNEVSVYSAYVDLRELQPNVSLVGLEPVTVVVMALYNSDDTKWATERLCCVFRHDNVTAPALYVTRVTGATDMDIGGNGPYPYNPVFIRCRVPVKLVTICTRLSIVRASQSENAELVKPNNFLRLHLPAVSPSGALEHPAQDQMEGHTSKATGGFEHAELDQMEGQTRKTTEGLEHAGRGQKEGRNTKKRSSLFTVCTSPFSRRFNDVNQLVEFIEVNRLFGADSFTFYNMSIGPDLLQYLDSYVNEGIVRVMPWTIPYVVNRHVNAEREVHYFAQILAFNDCVYRNMYSAEHVVLVDIDEHIVPSVATNWIDMMDIARSKCGASDTSPIGEYSFRCTFFRTEWPPDERYNITVTNSSSVLSSFDASISVEQRYNIRTLLYTKREQVIWSIMQRSKMIIDPRMVLNALVHFVMEFSQRPIGSSGQHENPKRCDVDVSDGMLFHYRCWTEDDGCVPIKCPVDGCIVNKRMHDFEHHILKRIVERHQKLADTAVT